jgi:excisionase family DNA binding protein
VSVTAELIVSPVPRVALSIEEACAALGVSWDTWSEHIAPHVKIVRVGRRKLVPVAELEKWLATEAERQRLPTVEAA